VTYSAADLELATRHVTEAEERIAEQRRLIARLKERGQPTGDALVLLGLFSDTLEQMVIHRDAIAAQIQGLA
jgi:hypothetical protein